MGHRCSIHSFGNRVRWRSHFSRPLRFNVIVLWLGHESTTTAHRYVEVDVAMKEKSPSTPGSTGHKDATVPGTELAHAVLAAAETM